MKWLIILPLHIIVNVIAYLFAWLFAFYTKYGHGPIDNGNSEGYGPRLPNWLSWFQTVDNSLYGDRAWQDMQEGHWSWRTKLYGYPTIQSYFGRLGWLLRNPGQGFERTSYVVANIQTDAVVRTYGNPFIKDKPNGVHGYCVTIIDNYWGFYAIIPLWKGRCMKVKLGWNLKTYSENTYKVLTNPTAPFVLTVSFPSFVA